MTTSACWMLVSNRGDLVARARHLSTQPRQPAAHHEHTEIGFNYRLSNILAALGRTRLSRLDRMLARRRAVRQMDVEGFADPRGVRFQGRGQDARSRDDEDDNCWLTSTVLDPAVHDVTPAMLHAELADEDIESRPLWKPMHLQPVFTSHVSFVNGELASLFDRGVTVPSGSALQDDAIERVIKVVHGALNTSR